MTKRRRFLAGTLAAVMMVSIIGKYEVSVYAQEPLDETQGEKQYVILAEDETVYEQVADEVSDSIVEEEAPVLSENNVIVAQLTETEAEVIAEENDVWIEEDILLFGSTSEEEAETPQAAWAQMKAEKIRRAEEYMAIEEAEDTEGAEEEPEYEWNLQAVNADTAAADEGENLQRVKVAVLDSGVDMVSGIDLSGTVNLVEEEQYLSEMFLDMTGHGTGIAGVIAGNGETGLYGVNPNAELYSVKVLDRENKAPLSRIIRGIYWCIENNINIINMSFGTPVYSKALEQAISDAYAQNILMVAAAGNNGEGVEYPAALDEVMAVASTDTQAQLSEFSNTGEELEIAAPGEKIRAAGFFDGSQVTHGTSIAVPHVTGAASLLWEKDLTKSNAFIRSLLSQSAKDIEGTDGYGLLDVEYALASYDAFAANYNEGDEERAVITENPESPQSFTDVDADDLYVEGLWHSDSSDKEPGHKELLKDNTAGFTAEAVKIIKQGIVFPDTENIGWHVINSEGKKIRDKWMHGFSQVTESGTTTQINYVAVYELMTKIAVKGGNLSGFTDYTDIFGINKTIFNKVVEDIRKIDFNKFSFANTKANRKYFLYGCAMHGMSDAFAHSTTTPGGYLIRHTDPDARQYADNAGYYKKRYEIAKKAVAYSLQTLLNDDSWSDGEEILRAFKKVYPSDTNFKMVRIKKYMNANGYNDEVLARANIDSYKK